MVKTVPSSAGGGGLICGPGNPTCQVVKKPQGKTQAIL